MYPCIQRYSALQQTGHAGQYRRWLGNLPQLCRRRTVHLLAQSYADQLLYLRLCLLYQRRSNDLPRATLSVSELVELTIEFYRRNYIEGLFLSSGVVRSPDYTMERLVRVAKDLRQVHRLTDIFI